MGKGRGLARREVVGEERDEHLFGGEAAVMAVERLIKDIFFVPPDGFALKGKDDDIACAFVEFGVERRRPKEAVFDQVFGVEDLGDTVEGRLQEGEGLFEVLGEDVEEEVACGADGGDEVAFSGFSQHRQEGGKTGIRVEEKGALWIGVDLPVIGGKQEKRVVCGALELSEEQALDQRECQIDLFVDLGGGGSVAMGDRVDVGAVEAKVGGRGGALDAFAKIK